MKRRTFDVMMSLVGLFLAVVLLVAGGLLTWASSFIGTQVHDQLAAQQIYFPPEGSPALEGDAYEPIRQFAGQQLTTGAQAEAYANHYIGVHLDEMADGKTYAELSTLARENPDDEELPGLVDQMFRGETLRGLLLNAYAFGTMGSIAGIAAVAAFVGAAVLVVLGLLGLRNARRTLPTEELPL